MVAFPFCLSLSRTHTHTKRQNKRWPISLRHAEGHENDRTYRDRVPSPTAYLGFGSTSDTKMDDSRFSGARDRIKHSGGVLSFVFSCAGKRKLEPNGLPERAAVPRGFRKRLHHRHTYTHPHTHTGDVKQCSNECRTRIFVLPSHCFNLSSGEILQWRSQV